MRKSIFCSCLLVCLVCVDVGFSLPETLNVTDSSAPNDHQLTEDEVSNSEKNEGTKLNTLAPEFGDEMGSSLPSSRKLLIKDIPSVWETRGLFSPRRNRSMYRSPFGRRGGDYGMSPRSFSRMGRRSGYGDRFPRRFGRYAPYGRYDRDEYTMGNYQPYPQRFEGYAPQNFPSYQQTEQFPPQFQTQFSQPQQQSYRRPQAGASLAQAQSYYRDPYTQSQQPPQQFASSTPAYFPDAQQMNVRPQSVPSSSSSYYTNGRPVRSELPRVDSFSQFGTSGQPTDRRAGAGSRTQIATPTLQTDRYQPTGALEIPSTGSSFSRFGTSSLQPAAVGERDGAGSRTIQGNRDRPIGSEVQRTSAPLDRFRTSSTQSVDQRTGSGSDAGLRENRENGDRLVQSASEFQRTSLEPTTSDQLQTSTQSSGQRDGPQPAVETQENGGQSPPLSGLFSFLRSSPSATATDTLQSSRSILGFGPLETQEQPKSALVQSQAATVAA